jgi:hypothetical protein
MYIISNGQIIRPSPEMMETTPTVAPTKRRTRKKKVSNTIRRCKQIVCIIILLLIMYVFTCTKCSAILQFLRK